jgi:uncharacterized phage protein (TIGR01671 family)
MREILFRGKRSDGEWVFGHYYTDVSYHKISLIKRNSRKDLFGEGAVFEVYPETVGQYTGLKDENGVMIFEWDIVRMQGKIYEVKHTKINCAFELYNIETSLKLPAHHLIGSLVIGNIHDTPELLGRERD